MEMQAGLPCLGESLRRYWNSCDNCKFVKLHLLNKYSQDNLFKEVFPIINIHFSNKEVNSVALMTSNGVVYGILATR